MGLYRIEAPMDQALAMADVLVKVLRAARRRAREPARVQGPRASTGSRSTGSRTTATGSSATPVASLFANGIDPMVVIRWRDIFLRLERAIDATETAAHILEGIVIKNA